MDAVNNDDVVNIGAAVDSVNINSTLGAMSDAYHHGDLRRALIDAALEALARDRELPALRALARACGVSRTAPYRHFESYEDLQGAVVAEGFRRMEERIQEAVQREIEPFRRLRAGNRAYILFGRDHPAWYALMFGNPALLRSHAEGSAEARLSFQRLAEGVGACGVADPVPVARTVWTALHGMVDMLRLGFVPARPGGDADAQIERVLDMIGAHVRTVAG